MCPFPVLIFNFMFCTGSDDSETEKRLFKCICAIISAYCFFLLMPAILSTIPTAFQVDQKTMYAVTVFYFQNVQPISNSLSLPVLYTFSWFIFVEISFETFIQNG